ncbi:sulfatase-like hydrolase/transferase [Streptomyces sp. A7024]|uniref:Sulfatase-like hydrolase/transferase n=1 Tax=Streptomyces coryli TaxID=1128680 RepID=A0A6G4TTF7_9ACTN|nr:sulfatase-like hydrolase/transferase [Streptomyces coryli]NGN62746.1 sulfatase-like hydrolase/transferase [Streptomyces coryli]
MPGKRPAVLLITADQLRRDALGCYGGRAVATPHLDRLAGEGTVFDRAYTASPTCLPSRSSLLTGRYPRNHGAYSNFRDVAWLSPELPNLYRAFGEAGYEVGHVGKCHFAPVPYGNTRPDATLPYDDFFEHYRKLGIDHLALQDGKHVSVWFRDDFSAELEAAGYLDAYRKAMWDQEARKVFTFPGPAEWHPDAWVGRKAVELITSRATGDGPLFAWVSFSGPHFPFDPPAEYLERVDEAELGEPRIDPEEWTDPARLHYRSFHGPSKGRVEGGGDRHNEPEYWRRLRKHYAANVALIDDQVGAVVAAAKERYGDDLVVAFTCDHGEMLGNHGFWGKLRCYYDDVLRVPLIVRRPGGVGAGERSDRLTSLVDVYPTLRAAAGLAPDAGCDGRHVDETGHAHVFAEGEGFTTVTDGRHKLATARAEGMTHTELHDTASDPGEVHNLAGLPEAAAVQRDLQAATLDALLRTTLP